MSILGTRVVRTEDPLFLTRGALYTDDLTDERLAGALHADLRALPGRAWPGGVRGHVGSARGARGGGGPDRCGPRRPLADPAGVPVPPPGGDPRLAGKDTVRFVGDLIAVVLTEERYQGEDAAERVEVDIDPLPAVVGTEAAARDEVLLFPEAGTNVLASFGEPAPEDFFAGCEVVVTQRIVNQRVAPVPLETRAAAAAWGEDGRVTIWCSNQGAQAAKMEIASWLGLDSSLVHLITPAVGGGFGAKIGADPEFALVAHVGQARGPAGALGGEPLGEPASACCTAAARTRSSPSAAGATAPWRPTAWSSTRMPAPTPGSASCCPRSPC